MPSRKSPSQRGVEGRLARVVASMIPGTHGGRVVNAYPVLATAVSRPASAPGGGGVLGWARVALGFDAVTANGSLYYPTGITITASAGAHGLTVSGTTLSYGMDAADSYYLTHAQWQSVGWSGATTDVYRVACATYVDDISGLGLGTCFISLGSEQNGLLLGVDADGMPVELRVTCPGNTTAAFTSAGVVLQVMRFAVPV